MGTLNEVLPLQIYCLNGRIVFVQVLLLFSTLIFICLYMSLYVLPRHSLFFSFSLSQTVLVQVPWSRNLLTSVSCTLSHVLLTKQDCLWILTVCSIVSSALDSLFHSVHWYSHLPTPTFHLLNFKRYKQWDVYILPFHLVFYQILFCSSLFSQFALVSIWMN